jgi:hypothetical protein
MIIAYRTCKAVVGSYKVVKICSTPLVNNSCLITIVCCLPIALPRRQATSFLVQPLSAHPIGARRMIP